MSTVSLEDASNSFALFRSSSKAWLILVGLLYLVYGIYGFFKLKRAETDISVEKSKLDTYVGILEHYLAVPFFMFVIAIEMTAFYVISAIFGFILLPALVFLFLGERRDNKLFRVIGKVLNVAMTTCVFVVIWADNYSFF